MATDLMRIHAAELRVIGSADPPRPSPCITPYWVCMTERHMCGRSLEGMGARTTYVGDGHGWECDLCVWFQHTAWSSWVLVTEHTECPSGLDVGLTNQLTEPPGGANTSHRAIHNITCKCVACGTLVATSRHTRYTGAKQIMYFSSLSVTTTVLPT